MDPIKEDVKKIKIVAGDDSIEQHDYALDKVTDEPGPGDDDSLAQTKLVNVSDAISLDWRSITFGLTFAYLGVVLFYSLYLFTAQTGGLLFFDPHAPALTLHAFRVGLYQGLWGVLGAVVILILLKASQQNRLFIGLVSAYLLSFGVSLLRNFVLVRGLELSLFGLIHFIEACLKPALFFDGFSGFLGAAIAIAILQKKNTKLIDPKAIPNLVIVTMSMVVIFVSFFCLFDKFSLPVVNWVRAGSSWWSLAITIFITYVAPSVMSCFAFTIASKETARIRVYSTQAVMCLSILALLSASTLFLFGKIHQAWWHSFFPILVWVCPILIVPCLVVWLAFVRKKTENSILAFLDNNKVVALEKVEAQINEPPPKST